MSRPVPRNAEALAGGVLVVGLPGGRLDPATRTRLASLDAAGVILFRRNLENDDQVRALTDEVRSALDDPLVLIDQEGGRVDRLALCRGGSPSARDLARLGVSAVAGEAARTAADLRRLGVNFNCVPVLDLDEGNEANFIGDRSFGSEPDDVAALARAVIDAHRDAGIATCLKHFPGLGRTHLDTHEVRPMLDLDRDELHERELAPYRLLADHCPAIMVSHVALPRITGSLEAASLSTNVIGGLIRRDLGFSGLIVSDDLGMGAVADRGPDRQAVEALGAGCDLLLYCQPTMEAAEQAREAIARAATLDAALDARLRDAHGRVLALRRALAAVSWIA